MKTVSIKAGEHKRVIYRFSNSLQETYHFKAEPINPADDLSGIIEISGSNWLFPKPSVKENLMRENSVSKGAWDSLYSVYVVPDVDVNISFSGSDQPNLKFLLLIAGLIAIAALSIVAFSLIK